jgi:sugar lactone lactonase YvrE
MMERLRLGLALGALGVVAACGGDPGTSSADVTEEAPRLESHALSQADLQPEGLAYDPVTQAFFVSSLRHGTVTRVTTSGEERIVLETGVVSLGMEADASYGNLWVCSIDEADAKRGTVHRIDLDTLAVVASYPLRDVFDTASCNDVTVDGDGNAYVTDRENPHVYRIDPWSGEASLWLAHDELDPELIGMNGIVIAGDTMIVTKYLPGRLYAISMSDPQDVREIELEGDWFHVVFHPFSGADGIELVDGELYVAFDAAAFRLRALSDDWTRAEVERLDVQTHGGLTAIVAADGTLYGSNGQAPEYVLGSTPDPARIWDLGL